MKSVFRDLNQGQSETGLNGFIQKLNEQSSAQGGRYVSEDVVRSTLAAESMSQSGVNELKSALTVLRSTIKSATVAAGLRINPVGQKGERENGSLTFANEAAAVTAGVLASAPRRALAAKVVTGQALAAQAGSDVFVVGDFGGDSITTRPALEAYDNTNNSDVVSSSVSYNLLASRQNDFAEAFFPTVMVPPDNLGLEITLRLNYVEKEVRRALSGAATEFGRINVLKAHVDPTILDNTSTKVVPVVRSGGANDSTAHFVASSDVAPYAVLINGESITTAPMKFGDRIDLMGLSQPDSLVAAGTKDNSDSLDPGITLAAIYVKLGANGGNKVLKFTTDKLPGATFTQALQGNTRTMQLNFSTQAPAVRTTTTDVTGAAVTQLGALSDKVVRLKFSAFGSVTLDTGLTELTAGTVSVASVTDSTGTLLDLTTGTGATMATIFAGATLLGWDVLAYRSNSNRRQRGQLVNTQHIRQMYSVPLLPPITSPRPIGAGDQGDNDAIQALITTTHCRTSSAAVTELLDAVARIKEYVNSADAITQVPAVMGVSRELVTAQYLEAAINAATDLDSLTSSQRPEDMQALLVNVIRDMAFRLYTGSALQVALQSVNGGVAAKPLLIIGTDPTLARYLTLTGDTRLATDYFDFKVVSTLDRRMTGKIIITFGVEEAYGSGVPHPLHFGTHGWCPEVVTSIPMTRNGAISQELTVAPRFRHISNLPVAGQITVSNITSAMTGKVTVNVSQ